MVNNVVKLVFCLGDLKKVYECMRSSLHTEVLISNLKFRMVTSAT